MNIVNAGETSTSSPVWLHTSRFLLVISILVNSYTLVVAFHVLVNDVDNVSVVYALNTVGCFILVLMLSLTVVEGKSYHLPAGFQWGVSYVLAWVGVAFCFCVSFLYVVVVKCEFTEKDGDDVLVEMRWTNFVSKVS